MSTSDTPMARLLASLRERAKELNCLYSVDEILADPDQPLSEICQRLVDALPAGWQHPDDCCAKIRIRGIERQTANFVQTDWKLTQHIFADGEDVGELAVHYTVDMPVCDEGPFLKEERRLIRTLAERIGLFVTRRELRETHDRLGSVQRDAADGAQAEWRVILDFLRRTDPDSLRSVTRRLLNQLGLLGVAEADRLLQKVGATRPQSDEPQDDNIPAPRSRPRDVVAFSEEVFRIARSVFDEEELVQAIRAWLGEQRSSFLMEVLEDQSCTLSEIVEAIVRHESLIGSTDELTAPAQSSLAVAILRRVFSDDLDFVNVARQHVKVEDTYEIVKRIVYSGRGHGKLGGKSAGLCLASHLLRDAPSKLLRDVKVPAAWYVSSDVVTEFLSYNNLRELFSRKYLPVEAIRQEYPHIVDVLKNSQFPPEVSRGLAVALDELDGRPLIVRSSSLLEDRVGSSFAGKYKSLFLANQGDRAAQLSALKDAIAEIYASIFSPDAIEYRAERGLINVHEEMGILIQQVVGRQIGRFYLPAFSGVAFSNNEFRWSPRIRREDGLVRMVPGLGTRAVDRVGDDYPVLVAPGQPGLRVNVTPDEVLRYSPRRMDVIDLEGNSFRTVKVDEFLREFGAEFPEARKIVSIAENDRIRKPVGLEPDFENDQLVVTFDGLITGSPFLTQVREILEYLGEKLGHPVDIEFAADGDELYLVQCRAQSHSEAYAPAAIPRHLPADRVLFSAHRNISNGRVPDISHIVYVDPDRYAGLGEIQRLRDVGRAVGKLNRLLPKRRFVLIGPGRWGSRGDIRLGVPVTYADISNTAVLIEVARQKGNYVPELSFGTHFFQDMVESEIRYVPIYLDQPPNRLDELFLRRGHNALPELLPEFDGLAEVVRVIDVARETDGRVLRVLMNADLDEAVGVFDSPSSRAEGEVPVEVADSIVQPHAEAHWRWRIRMAERIAAELDPARFGVKALFVFGSVKNASAGPASDIDLLVHDGGDGPQREGLALWLDGWSKSLAEVNYLRTGYRSEGLLDVHYVTDDDIDKKTSFASKIGAVTDPARALPLRSSGNAVD